MPWEDDRRSLPRETELQRARRHLRETRERLARQEVIVADMEANNSRFVWLGRELLEIMRTATDGAEWYVGYLLRKGAG